MTDDATIERVARAIFPEIVAAVTGRATTQTYESAMECDREDVRELACIAITAYLSAMPGRELLAEALEALENLLGFGINRSVESQMAQDDARAAADKIRAALEHQP
jgi:hypothetical protein